MNVVLPSPPPSPGPGPSLGFFASPRCPPSPVGSSTGGSRSNNRPHPVIATTIAIAGHTRTIVSLVPKRARTNARIVVGGIHAAFTSVARRIGRVRIALADEIAVVTAVDDLERAVGGLDHAIGRRACLRLVGAPRRAGRGWETWRLRTEPSV